ncbi:O-antigen ligase family protein [uncultured Methylophaga sp.]|uniref:O-antigen ligase family protein n=1 Tax=uncultured Methylophaga sp. TaxID=285271 RepID=UPI0030DA88FA|tara:strand:+ start:1721 stop:3238 length:1518 start_codon:yes stop_codon:yes gene_type:complete
MPEYIQTLLVITVLTGLTFSLMNKALVGNFDIQQLKKWQFSWFLMLYGAVLLKNIWFIAAAVFIIANLKLPAKSIQRVYVYLVLICTIPLIYEQIPGFAGIQNIIPLSYTNLMIMSLLLPVMITLKSPQKLFSIPTDKYIVLFITLLSLLQFRDNTITNAGRESFLFFIDIFVPYYAITRLVNTQERLKMALTALFIGIIPFALIGVFELLTSWFMYTSIAPHIGYISSFNQYRDIRGGGLRAMAVFFGPIVLGYVMIYAGAILLYLQHFIKNRKLVLLAFGTVFLCLLATKSRGPWIGFALMLMMFIWTGRNGFGKLVKYGILGLGVLILASLTPAGSKYVELLPFIGDERADTFDYRARLLENSMILFKKNPLFGDINFRNTSEMESLRQGEGIIDVVNTYIGILLPYGLISLILFVGAFVFLVIRCRNIVKRPDIDIESKLTGRILISCIVGVMFTIFTVSSISYIPTFYWVLIALSSAYINIHKPKSVRINNELLQKKVTP